MDRPSIGSHFHIHWDKKKSLDWEGFETHAGALARAFELARPGEKFTIEEVPATCSVCAPPVTESV